MQFAENYRNISRNRSTQPRKQKKKNFVNLRVKIPTNRQIDRRTNRRIDRQTERQTERQID